MPLREVYRTIEAWYQKAEMDEDDGEVYGHDLQGGHSHDHDHNHDHDGGHDHNHDHDGGHSHDQDSVTRYNDTVMDDEI